MVRSPDSLNPGIGQAYLDVYAASMCMLCLLHCIAIPIASILLPVLGVLSENELIHQLLVLLAAPATLWLVCRATLSKQNLGFVIMALVGLGLLLLAAFVEAVSRHETLLTLIGATLLGFAHVRRWLHLRRWHRSQVQT